MFIKAEEVEILGCAPCTEFVSCACTVRGVEGPIKYEHYAEIYKGQISRFNLKSVFILIFYKVWT